MKMSDNLNNLSKDILQPLSRHELKSMLKNVEEHLPQSIRGHHYIYAYLKNSINFDFDNLDAKFSDRFKVQFYGHRDGSTNNSTFIAITGDEDHWVFLYTLEESPTELIECIRNTKRIDWNKKPMSISFEKRYELELMVAFNEKRSNWIRDITENIWCLRKNIAKSIPIVVPQGLALRSLTIDDADIINKNWSHNYPGSLKLIQTSILVNNGVGLVRKETNELLSWMLTNDFLSPGFLFTLENERRKGYGLLVCKAENKRIATSNNLDSLSYVVQGNERSEYMHRKLGFEVVNEIVWIYT